MTVSAVACSPAAHAHSHAVACLGKGTAAGHT